MPQAQGIAPRSSGMAAAPVKSSPRAKELTVTGTWQAGTSRRAHAVPRILDGEATCRRQLQSRDYPGVDVRGRLFSAACSPAPMTSKGPGGGSASVVEQDIHVAA